MYPQPQGWHLNREGKVHLSASRRSGARVDGMVNLGECSTKRRYVEQAKDAERLEPKGTMVGIGCVGYPIVDSKHHRRREQTYPIWLSMRNTVSPSSSHRVEELQDSLMGWRVKDGGKSECCPVMGRIRIEPQQYHPLRKQADFHRVSHHERIWPTDSGGKADNSPSGWCSFSRKHRLADP
jgi:hypothetical protein